MGKHSLADIAQMTYRENVNKVFRADGFMSANHANARWFKIARVYGDVTAIATEYPTTPGGAVLHSRYPNRLDSGRAGQRLIGPVIGGATGCVYRFNDETGEWRPIVGSIRGGN